VFNSKFFCIIISLTTLALVAAVYLQVDEMLQYNLLTALQERYFPSSGAAEPAKDAEKDKAETAKKPEKPAAEKKDAKK
jgi:hypothetical protein